jgi:perosamine synthetase
MPAGRSKFRMSKEPTLDRRFLQRRPQTVGFPGDQCPAQRLFFFQARNAIYHGLRALRLSPGDVVLLPSYLCAAAIEPVIVFGASVEFYRINLNCRPDFADLERRINRRTKAVLAVHYFGFPCDIAKFRELCDGHKLSLIEDCAHVLRGDIEGKPIGSFGDISVFSWRKFLPMLDGGELVLNVPGDISVPWHKETYVFDLKVAKNLVEQSAEYGDSGSLKILGSLLELTNRGRNLLRRKGNATALKPPVDSNDLEFDESQINLPMSRISRWVLERSDILTILAKRRENYAFFKREFSSAAGICLMFPESGVQHSPWVFPLVFEGAEKAHLALRARGIPAVTWDGVRHPSIPRGKFPEADFLYANLVMLPVHQNLNKRDLHTIVEESHSIRQSCDPGTAGNHTGAPN